MGRAGGDAAGFALAELLVVLAVLGLILGGCLSLLVSAQQSYGFGAARVEAQQAARAGLERMVKELREAGYDPTGAGLAAIVVAEPARVVFQRDLNENGVIDPTRERVTFLLRGGVLRRDAGGGAQPLAEGAQRLAFTYYDPRGVETADPARVASIRIALEVGIPGAAVLLESQVSLRNDSP
jgi:type IV pilus assembly protein PilW